MRAAVVTRPGGPEVLQLQEIEEPKPGPDDLLVNVKATALNRADLMQRQGNYPTPGGTRSDVLGLEMAGIVATMGERVVGFKPGDRVCALLNGAGYAERVAFPAAMAVPIPPNLDFVQAAAVPEVFITAYDALFNCCELKMGEWALIHAVGSCV